MLVVSSSNRIIHLAEATKCPKAPTTAARAVALRNAVTRTTRATTIVPVGIRTSSETTTKQAEVLETTTNRPLHSTMLARLTPKTSGTTLASMRSRTSRCRSLTVDSSASSSMVRRVAASKAVENTAKEAVNLKAATLVKTVLAAKKVDTAAVVVHKANSSTPTRTKLL